MFNLESFGAQLGVDVTKGKKVNQWIALLNESINKESETNFWVASRDLKWLI
jgi:hypothetical protein